jgi:hypothetical protein
MAKYKLQSKLLAKTKLFTLVSNKKVYKASSEVNYEIRLLPFTITDEERLEIAEFLKEYGTAPTWTFESMIIAHSVFTWISIKWSQ